MNEKDDKILPRRTILEFRSPSASPKRKRRSDTHFHDINLSLEIQPVIKAVENYGRKTHSIGAMQGACAIQNLIDEINALGPHSDEIQKLLKKGSDMAVELRSYTKNAYEEV